MSRKHFKAIAEALASSKPPAEYVSCVLYWKDTVETVARNLAQFNSSFNYSTFCAACGLDK